LFCLLELIVVLHHGCHSFYFDGHDGGDCKVEIRKCGAILVKR
jgi:hypothetical protein